MGASDRTLAFEGCSPTANMLAAPMDPNRERLVNWLFVFAGAAVFLVALLGDNDIQYLPTDPRSQPWFQPTLTLFLAAIGLGFLITGIIRMWRARRH